MKTQDFIGLKATEWMLLRAKTDYEFTIHEAKRGNLAAAEQIGTYRTRYLLAKDEYENTKKRITAKGP